MRTRWWVVLVVVVVLVAAGVVAVWRFGGSGGGAEASAVVGPNGVVLEYEGITVRGPAGVAPVGTRLSAGKPGAASGSALDFATAVGDGIALDLGGAQPAAPLTITMPLPDFPGGDTAGVLVTRPSGATDTVLVPATYSAADRTVTAQVRHLSDFWAAFAPLSKFVDVIGRTTTQALGITTPRPDCAGKDVAAPDGSTIAVSGVDAAEGASPTVWPCVAVDGDDLVLTLTSNTPLAWQTTPKPGATLVRPTTTDVSKGVTIALFQTLTGRPDQESLLPPGTSLSYRFPLTALPAEVTGDDHPIALLGMVLLLGVDLVLKTFGVDSKGLLRTAETVGCVADAFGAATAKPDEEAVAAMIRAVFSCAGKIGEALTGAALVPLEIVLTLLGSAVSLLAGNLMGILATALGVDKFTVKVARTGVPTTVVNVVAARAGQPAAGYTAGPRSSAPLDNCFPSSAAVTPDIVSCGATAAGADVCWIAPDRRGLLCGTNPWEKKLLSYTADKPLPRTAQPDAPRPWALELSDGSRCRLRNGGAWPGRADGYAGAYSCTGPTEFVLADSDTAVDRSGPVWTVLVGDLGADNPVFPPPTTMSVTTAYFAST
ncbi:hypothetical protein [Actinosynnema sp. NPDC020468]|uniref:hypothetical protein n=1 Tax=Actinosynnema sp. NPDC020468 TaxID=3154488 RepID=UPI0033C9C5E0